MKNIIIDKTKGFIELTAKENYYITDYKEGDDISLYSSSKKIYCPMTVLDKDGKKVPFNVEAIYHSISDTKDVEYKTLKEKAVEAQLAEMKHNSNN